MSPAWFARDNLETNMNQLQTLKAATKIVFGPESDILAEKHSFPNAWRLANERASTLIKTNDPASLAGQIKQIEKTFESKKTSIKNKTLQPVAKQKIIMSAVDDRFLLRQIHEKLKLMAQNISAKKTSKRDIWLAQKLFFKPDYARNCPRLWLAKLVWPLIKNKGGISYILQKQGIYSVYTREFVKKMAHLLKPYAQIIEIAAGDGTLSLELEKFGVKVHATDNHSWHSSVRYPDWVENCDATSALDRYQPQAVICSWPPPGNTFEKQIFLRSSVQVYLVIVSQHEYAAGDFSSYLQQKTFTMEEALDLNAMLLPPESQQRVLIFRRI